MRCTNLTWVTNVHLIMNHLRGVYNELKCRFFSQNTTLLFNKPATCFGYSFIAITRTIPGIYNKGNSIVTKLVGYLGPDKVLYKVYNVMYTGCFTTLGHNCRR